MLRLADRAGLKDGPPLLPRHHVAACRNTFVCPPPTALAPPATALEDITVYTRWALPPLRSQCSLGQLPRTAATSCDTGAVRLLRQGVAAQPLAVETATGRAAQGRSGSAAEPRVLAPRVHAPRLVCSRRFCFDSMAPALPRAGAWVCRVFEIELYSDHTTIAVPPNMLLGPHSQSSEAIVRRC
jgi:hypothetical protein